MPCFTITPNITNSVIPAPIRVLMKDSIIPFSVPITKPAITITTIIVTKNDHSERKVLNRVSLNNNIHLAFQ